MRKEYLTKWFAFRHSELEMSSGTRNYMASDTVCIPVMHTRYHGFEVQVK